MSQQFICISNPGVAPVEAFTLLGASNKAGTEAIGCFGSGTKFGTLALLREGLFPIIYSGLARLEFGLKDIAFEGDKHQQVFIKLSGKIGDKQVNRTEDLSWVLRYGEIDWKDIRLALREFVSNALDAVQGNASQVKVEIVDSCRAKAGTTRVYISLNAEGQDFVTNIGHWFLHFIGGIWKSDSVIEKTAPSPAKIYRRGVLVREVVGKDSLFDYNLNSLPLDEARVANDYTVAYYAAQAFNKVLDPKVIARLLLADGNLWETTFDLNSYEYSYGENKVQRDTAWAEAQKLAFNDSTVLVHASGNADLAEGKGYAVKRLPENVYNAAVSRGLRTQNTILSNDELEGRVIDVTPAEGAENAVRYVWGKLLQIGSTRDEVYPQVKTFSKVGTSAGGQTNGFYRDGTVFINTRLLSGDQISQELFATVLEELCHYVTKATDCSRDFQNWLIDSLVKILK